MVYDTVIVGGGPAGLAAALALGRARKRVLLCDAGPPRNKAAEHVYNFLTRDATPPAELRRLGREQLKTYPNVEVQDAHVASITGDKGAFQVELGAGSVESRRVLLCTGMRDQMLPIEGFKELWGRSIFQCPYCHGWETQDRKWGYLVHPKSASHLLPFALQARGWTSDLTVFTAGAFEVDPESRDRLSRAGISICTAPIARLVDDAGHLSAVELADGRAVPCHVIYTHPPQSQVELVRALDVDLDDNALVTTTMMGETSTRGIYAAGDLCTQGQAAIMGAAAGTRTAAAINVDLAMEFGSDDPRDSGG